MPFQYNGVAVGKLLYNGTEVSKLQINGVEVWTSGPTVLFSPNFYNTVDVEPNPQIEIYLYPDRTMRVTELWSDDTQITDGLWLAAPLPYGVSQQFTIKNTSPSAVSLDVQVSGGSVVRIAQGQSTVVTMNPSAPQSHAIMIDLVGNVTSKTVAFEVTAGSSVGTFTIYA